MMGDWVKGQLSSRRFRRRMAVPPPFLDGHQAETLQHFQADHGAQGGLPTGRFPWRSSGPGSRGSPSRPRCGWPGTATRRQTPPAGDHLPGLVGEMASPRANFRYRACSLTCWAVWGAQVHQVELHRPGPPVLVDLGVEGHVGPVPRSARTWRVMEKKIMSTVRPSRLARIFRWRPPPSSDMQVTVTPTGKRRA